MMLLGLLLLLLLSLLLLLLLVVEEELLLMELLLLLLLLLLLQLKCRLLRLLGLLLCGRWIRGWRMRGICGGLRRHIGGRLRVHWCRGGVWIGRIARVLHRRRLLWRYLLRRHLLRRLLSLLRLLCLLHNLLSPLQIQLWK